MQTILTIDFTVVIFCETRKAVVKHFPLKGQEASAKQTKVKLVYHEQKPYNPYLTPEFIVVVEEAKVVRLSTVDDLADVYVFHLLVEIFQGILQLPEMVFLSIALQRRPPLGTGSLAQ